MKIIDLLNKIAIGEEVPHFKVGALEYYLNWRGNLLEREEDKPSADVQWFIDKEWLNTEVEIIEDKKIENIKVKSNFTHNQKQIVRKINEIINYINKGD